MIHVHLVSYCTCFKSLQGQDCFICKKGGHYAKDCPEKQKRGSLKSQICLKCGDSGHDMFSCRNDYLTEDLKVFLWLLSLFSIWFLYHINHEIYCLELCLRALSKFLFLNQEIQCYVCKRFGHLCCVKYVDTSSQEVSCYKCGQLGHTGLVSLVACF